MRLDLRERLEFLADELVREEAIALVVVAAPLVMELEGWGAPAQVRLVERPDAPGLYELEARTVVPHAGPDS